jgi:hypothetical protein
MVVAPVSGRQQLQQVGQLVLASLEDMANLLQANEVGRSLGDYVGNL